MTRDCYRLDPLIEVTKYYISLIFMCYSGNPAIWYQFPGTDSGDRCQTDRMPVPR